MSDTLIDCFAGPNATRPPGLPITLPVFIQGSAPATQVVLPTAHPAAPRPAITAIQQPQAQQQQQVRHCCTCLHLAVVDQHQFPG